MKTRNGIVCVAALCAAVSGLALTACSSGSSRSGTVYKSEFGTLTADVAHPLEKVHDASIATLKEYELKIDKDEKDAFQSKIVAVGADGKKYKVDLKKKSPTVTEVSIGVGSFGDEARSTQILDSIEKRLKD